MSASRGERFLNISELAEKLGTSKGIARTIMTQNGVMPIDFGPGRSRGYRWLESAVDDVMRNMHHAVQPNNQHKSQVKCIQRKSKLADMSVNEVYKLFSA